MENELPAKQEVESCFIQETGPRLNINIVQDLPQDPDIIPNTLYEVMTA